MHPEHINRYVWDSTEVRELLLRELESQGIQIPPNTEAKLTLSNFAVTLEIQDKSGNPNP